MTIDNNTSIPTTDHRWLWLTSIPLALLTGILYVRTLHPGVGP